MRNLLESIVAIEGIADKLRRRGIPLKEYLANRDPETGAFPLYCAYMNEITALAEQRQIELGDLELILDNFYYREGDFRKGTMTSGALPPDEFAAYAKKHI